MKVLIGRIRKFFFQVYINSCKYAKKLLIFNSIEYINIYKFIFKITKLCLYKSCLEILIIFYFPKSILILDRIRQSRAIDEVILKS